MQGIFQKLRILMVIDGEEFWRDVMSITPFAARAGLLALSLYLTQKSIKA